MPGFMAISGVVKDVALRGCDFDDDEFEHVLSTADESLVLFSTIPIALLSDQLAYHHNLSLSARRDPCGA